MAFDRIGDGKVAYLESAGGRPSIYGDVDDVQKFLLEVAVRPLTYFETHRPVRRLPRRIVLRSHTGNETTRTS